MWDFIRTYLYSLIKWYKISLCLNIIKKKKLWFHSKINWNKFICKENSQLQCFLSFQIAKVQNNSIKVCIRLHLCLSCNKTKSANRNRNKEKESILFECFSSNRIILGKIRNIKKKCTIVARGHGDSLTKRCGHWPARPTPDLGIVNCTRWRKRDSFLLHVMVRTLFTLVFTSVLRNPLGYFNGIDVFKC